MIDRRPTDARLASALRTHLPAHAEPALRSRIAEAIETTPQLRPLSRILAGMADADPTLRHRNLLIAAALLAALTVAAAAAVGALVEWQRRDTNRELNLKLIVDESNPIPAVLYGEWVANKGGGDQRIPPDVQTLDLDGSVLIRLPGGTPLDPAERAVAFRPTKPGEGTLIVRSSGRCGEGRYHLRELVEDNGVVNRFFLDDPVDGCAARVDILLSPMGWVRPGSVDLVAGRTYGSWAFSEPFHFVMSTMDGSPGDERVAVARQWGTRGGLMIAMGCCWYSTLIDDQPVNVDVCDRTKGTMPDVPPTPEAVGRWLRSSSGLTVSDPVELLVDGRTALRYDLDVVGCTGGTGSMMPPEFFIGSRVYAIPTGDDTIVYAIWSDEGSSRGVLAGAEQLVRSMTFD